ncbi:conjugal transfer protein TrbM [Campylobacter sp. CNRCH_2016_3089]|uniref:TrbM/KikA/MpfK family conjugal transfer protein n=1 Tax=Campylobacter sp. CNRCH_2016_3089 TaxID=2911609 RepID=UPI0021E656ED|nr:TrbM/KikA/MpfK family conjugal transfer protein [Campylobacter sp. CNRCH_2016_3089]MCV3509201.1 conjugal transfer protein TrbM [Campylobacter sp. CNRCH_2016_3089]
MKKSFFGVKNTTLVLATTMLIGSNIYANEILSGDTRLACEAILCLSSGTRPGECSSALTRYFSIHFKKPWKTINARKAFLNLCPVQNDTNVEDLVLKNLVDDILPSADPRQCTPEYLNTQIETQRSDRKIVGYRIKTTMPNFCYQLINHEYTDYKTPKYKCSGEFYSPLEWQLNYKLQQISEFEYRRLPSDQTYAIERKCSSDRSCYNYYKKISPINKTCWTY